MASGAISHSQDIAVVGMAGRFPGARNVGEFWRNLCAGVESVSRFSDAELRNAGEDPALLREPGYVRAGAPLDDVELFDAGFFGFSAREAAILDPQHRHFLEVCWEALEDAGHVPATFAGAIGVFAGAGMHDYYVHHLAPNRRLMQEVGPFLVRHTGNDKDFLTTRVSYCFDLRGPSVTVQTACSTSLVAIHMAAQSLLNGECDLALAGGVTIQLPHRLGYLYLDGEILSPDGHCRAFDAQARGTIFGSGAGVVVLRRAADALAARDHVYAVLRGSAMNNDGRGKVSYLAPSLDGQARCAAEALAIAGVPASSIGYVETHGTGTPVGDPIEIAALTQAYGATPGHRCAVGSVKTNIGHLDTAAGVASFIKAVLALEHRQIPPSLNFSAPNPACAFDQSPFHVNSALTPWAPGDGPRRAAVNSLGVGGTNAHVVLEEAPPMPAAPGGPATSQVLCLSARSPAALDRSTERLAAFLRTNPDRALDDVAYTLQVGRRAFACRRTVVAASVDDAVRKLEASRGAAVSPAPETAPPVVFMFPGGGAQYPNMGRGLYEREPVFRHHIDEIVQLVDGANGGDLARLLFPAAADEAAAAIGLATATNSLLATFAVEYALTQLWQSKGIVPAAMLGHSLGEVVSACLAGVMSLADALGLVAARGRVLDSLPEGATLVVGMSEQALEPLLTPELSVAAVNGPALCVVSGAATAVAALESRLTARDVDIRRLRLSFAAHSALLDGHLEGFAREIAHLPLRAPERPLISNETGTWATADTLSTADYWVRQLRRPVRFADGLARVLEDLPGCVLLEVGPGTTLTSLALQARGPGRRPAVASMRHPQDVTADHDVLLDAVGRLWSAGVSVDWARYRPDDSGRRVSLPTYPFERERHWVDRPAVEVAPQSAAAPPSPVRLPSIDDWFSVPAWEPGPPAVAGAAVETVLVFADGDSFHDTVRDALRRRGSRVITVRRGPGAGTSADGDRIIRAGCRDDYDRLLTDLVAGGQTPSRVVHLWSLGGTAPLPDAVEASFDSLLLLAQSWAEVVPGHVHVFVVSNGMQRVADEPVPHPERALALGPCLVIPKENDAITFTSIDMSVEATPAGLDLLVRELTIEQPDSIVALRGAGRWLPTLRHVAAPSAQAPDIREGGVYLVTGGLGHVGLTLAEALARAARVTIVLLSRREFPPASAWRDPAAARPAVDGVAETVERLDGLRRLGATVEVVRGDVTDVEDLTESIADIVRRYGSLHGVIHAAGVLDDGPMQVKDLTTARAVLAPKVQGTLALERAIGDAPLDFFVLCSSTSSLLAPAGQVDYTAANAFLNAFAASRRLGKHQVRAIAWGAWAERGMAVRAALGVPYRLLGELPSRHPLLGALVEEGPVSRVFRARYEVGNLWVLDQHRLADGTAVLPGSAFLELFRAAGADAHGTEHVDLRNLHLLAPLRCADDQACDVRIALTKRGEVWEASVATRTGAGWTEHARASIARLDPASGGSPTVALDEIRRRCTRAWTGEGRHALAFQDRHLRFGPRWRVLEALRLGADEALATCELPGEFTADLDVWRSHPALSDLALHAGLPLVSGPDADLFVPMAIGAVRIAGNLPRRLYSHARLRGGGGTSAEAITFDVTVVDETGRVVIDVDEMVLRRLDVQARAGWSMATSARHVENNALPPSVTLGVRPAEGAEVFLRALGDATPPCIIASPLELSTLTAAEPSSARPAAAVGVAAPTVSAMAAPRDELERALCGLWAELLGVPNVGIHDNFFDLGGHSLIAVRLFNRIRKVYSVSFGLAVLFEAPTVAACAALLRQGLDVPAVPPSPPPPVAPGAVGASLPMDVIRRSPCLVPVQPNGRLRPFFLFPGIGGNVLGYQALTKFLQPDQPVIGLQSLGVDGRHHPLLSMREIAAHFVGELRSVQPKGPYLLGGFSFGGLVGLEVAHQLMAAGERVQLLALFDTLLDARDLTSPGLAARCSRLLTFWRRRVSQHTRALLATAPSGLPAYLGGKAHTFIRRQKSLIWRGAVAIQESVHNPNADESVDLPPSLHHVKDANVLAVKRYVPVPYPGLATLFRATERGLEPADSDANWRYVAAGGLTVVDVPGNHLSMFEPPNVWVLSSALDEVLRRAQSQLDAPANQSDARPIASVLADR